MSKKLTVSQPIVGRVEEIGLGSDVSFAKPGELVEFRGMEKLSRGDRLALNLLIITAWDKITEDIEHRVHRGQLAGSHESNDRIKETLATLRTVQVSVRGKRNGKLGWHEDTFLGPTFREDDPNGFVYYRFTPTMREIIAESSHWARLQTQVMFALSSKYAVALYEMVQKRAGLRQRFAEVFTLEEIRTFLGVPAGKLTRYVDLRRFCLEPALAEVNALSTVNCQLEAIMEGRSVARLKLMWFPKDEEEMKRSYDELMRHSAGRRARIRKTAETLSNTGKS